MYAQHILNMQHSYSQMNEIVDILHTARKGWHMNTLENLQMYIISK